MEKLDLLTGKVEQALLTIRRLRVDNEALTEKVGTLENSVEELEKLNIELMENSEGSGSQIEELNSQLAAKEEELSQALAASQEKDAELENLRLESGEKTMELSLMKEALVEKDEKIQAVTERVEQVMQSLEYELDLRQGEVDEEVVGENEVLDSENEEYSNDVQDSPFESEEYNADFPPEDDSEGDDFQASQDFFQESYNSRIKGILCLNLNSNP